ncbi:MAG: hypothetical protein AB7D51_11265 [Desulfovibrionaceae bacterium]
MPEKKAIAHYNRQALRVCARGQMDTALCSLANALRLSREVGSPALEAYSKNNMGVVYLRSGQPEHARACFRIAWDIAASAPARTRTVRRLIERNLSSLEGPEALVKAIGEAASEQRIPCHAAR